MPDKDLVSETMALKSALNVHAATKGPAVHGAPCITGQRWFAGSETIFSGLA